MMNTRQLRYFLAIAEEGSITRAAQRLNVAQPALSHHVRNLEETLQTELLVRRAHGVVPTEAGELLARRARTILDQLARTQDEITNLGSDPVGEVRIGLPATISEILTVPLVTIAREKCPKVKIVIAEAMSGFVRDWLLDGQVDLAVLYTDVNDASVRSRNLLSEELVLLAPPGTDKGQALPFAALEGRPLILPGANHGLRALLEAHARSHGISLETAIEIDSFKSIKALVAQGFGQSVLPRHAVAVEAGRGELSVCALDGLRREAKLMSVTSRPSTAATDMVKGLICEVVDDLVQTGRWAGADLPLSE